MNGGWSESRAREFLSSCTKRAMGWRGGCAATSHFYEFSKRRGRNVNRDGIRDGKLKKY